MKRFAKVAVDKAAFGYDRPYDYGIPQELLASAREGARVVVPFGSGNRRRQGIILLPLGAGGGRRSVPGSNRHLLCRRGRAGGSPVQDQAHSARAG